MDRVDKGKMTLKVLRTIAGLTQQQVADRVKVDRLTYLNWEQYKTFPSAKQLIKLSEVFGCSLDDFYFPIGTN